MAEEDWCSLSREDFEHALGEMGSVIDVSVSDLIIITDKARRHAQMRQAEALRVEDLMTQSVQTVSPETPLSEAAALLLSHRISGLPVVDNLNRLVGIVTEADFLDAIGVPCHRPTHSLWQTLENMFSHPIELRQPAETVSALMVADVVTLRPTQYLDDVLTAMRSHRVKRLVVVDDQGSPVGMITRSDLVRVFFERLRDSGGNRPAAEVG